MREVKQFKIKDRLSPPFHGYHKHYFFTSLSEKGNNVCVDYGHHRGEGIIIINNENTKMFNSRYYINSDYAPKSLQIEKYTDKNVRYLEFIL